MGCGRVAQHYKYIFQTQNLKGYIIVGVADLVVHRARSLGLDFNCPYYTCVDEMIFSSKPDLLLVLTPSGGHYHHALNGILKGINVLVEKPITMIPSQGIELLKIARGKGLLYGAVVEYVYVRALNGLARYTLPAEITWIRLSLIIPAVVNGVPVP